MRVKVSESAALFWDQGKLIWDDYLGHRQHALTADSERLLRWFSDWRDLDSVSALGEEYLAIANRLLEAGVLIAEDSAEHDAERRLLAHWGAWGPSARYLHFASRTLAGARFLSAADDAAEMSARARAHLQADAMPALSKTYPTRPVIEIADQRPEDQTWRRRLFLDAVYGRRSTRRFDGTALTLEELGAILHVAGGFIEVLDQSLGPGALKTSPSAGALHPFELYVDARAVDGLSPGHYHYSPARGGLERLASDGRPGPSLQSLGGQPWLTDAPALVLYTAMIERLQWRYRTPRAYRDLLIDLGHLSQTVLLTASASGLGGVFASAVCDESLEEAIGVDPMSEIILGVCALGRPAEDEPHAPIIW
jgi:SagB-type dehydrogenase family enzyme